MIATKRAVACLLCLFPILGIFACAGSRSSRLQALLDKIAHAPAAELPKIIYGYNESSLGAQQVLLGMLRLLHAPSPQQNMKVEAVHQTGRFTMIVAQVPWGYGPQKAERLPISVVGDAGDQQVVGYLLPFDDTRRLIQGTDMQNVGKLSMWWITEYAQRNG